MAGETSNVSLPLSVYLVVFIDLLGQSAELEKVKKMPTRRQFDTVAGATLTCNAHAVMLHTCPR